MKTCDQCKKKTKRTAELGPWNLCCECWLANNKPVPIVLPNIDHPPGCPALPQQPQPIYIRPRQNPFDPPWEITCAPLVHARC